MREKEKLGASEGSYVKTVNGYLWIKNNLFGKGQESQWAVISRRIRDVMCMNRIRISESTDSTLAVG